MNLVQKIINVIKKMLGWPPRATLEQQNEFLVTMRERRDCHIPAAAVACSNALGRKITYEDASRALWHWNLPWIFESPLISNPVNLQRGITRLGCKIESLKISELLHDEAQPGTTICLMHNPDNNVAGTLEQHWTVYMGRDQAGRYLFHWGQSQQLRAIAQVELIGLLTSGWPNCLFSVKKKG